MSFTCAKQYTIEVVSTTTVFAYYKCDEVAGLTLKEEVDGKDMTTSLITPVAGIINGGLSMFLLANYADTVTPSSYFNFANHDFSVRLWFKLHAPITYPSFAIFLAFNNWTIGYSFFTPYTGVTFYPGISGGGVPPITAGEVAPGGWHRFCVWLKQGVQMGIKLDNDPSITAVVPGTMTDYGDDVLALTPSIASPSGHSIDEIGIWKDKVLTEAEMLADWNAGAGKTYPNVP